MIGNSNPGNCSLPWQKLHGVTRRLLGKTDTIKQCNRNSSGLAAGSGTSVPSITAMGAARDFISAKVISAKGRSSMNQRRRIPPPTRPLAPLVVSEAPPNAPLTVATIE